MPAPEPPRRPKADLSAIPTFLRGSTPAERPAKPAGNEPATRRSMAIPRPVTPPPTDPEAPRAPRLDPSTLPMPSLSRRRVVTLAGCLIAGLLALSFARQVGDATAAANRASDLRAGNAALREEVARLRADLGQVQDPRFINLEGRSFGLGGPQEIPFALAAGAPALAPDAPGSASVRLGAPPQRSPIDAWLEVLFGGGA
ncbi:MAG TPA: hypothetical protein VE011_10740 [Candidatus Dormibacteraeota bacterium]|nr:hypothetical protein [Candidatus Dormibacteraeota bacterium]